MCNMYKLDKKDRKILAELDVDSRQSYSEIARKVGITKETCIYRINSLVDEKIITAFSTLISLGNLGLFSHKIYFKLHGLTKEKKEKMISDLRKNKKINWIAEGVGEFDLIIAIICKNVKEFDSEKKKILNKYSNFIQNYDIGIMSETHIYDRCYLLDKSSNKEMLFVGQINPVALDEKDMKILPLLTSNSRIQTLDLAKKTKLNVKTVVSRIKKLEKKGIISGYKLFIDLDKMGFKFHKAFISINKANAEDFAKFLDFCKKNKNIIHLVENVGSWELEPEFEVENDDKFYEIIAEIKNKFPDLVKAVSTVRIIKEHKGIYSSFDLVSG